MSGVEDVYARLKEQILTCALAPGAELRELVLVEETGHSRSTVRTALGRLVADQLVEVRPRKGYHVSEVDLADVREVFELRMLLEPAAAELAARRAPRARVEELHDLAHARGDAGDPAAYAAYLADNREFHVRIAEAAGNQRLAAALRGVLEEMQRLFFLSRATRSGGTDDRGGGEQAQHEHHALYDAILAGDAERARQVAETQIEESRERVLATLLDLSLPR